MLRSSVFAVLVLCCVGSLWAEQVTLKNGDRFTGSIVSMSDKKLVLKTEHAGTITIDFDAIAQFSSEQPLVVTRTDKQVVIRSGEVGGFASRGDNDVWDAADSDGRRRGDALAR